MKYPFCPSSFLLHHTSDNAGSLQTGRPPAAGWAGRLAGRCRRRGVQAGKPLPFAAFGRAGCLAAAAAWACRCRHQEGHCRLLPPGRADRKASAGGEKKKILSISKQIPGHTCKTNFRVCSILSRPMHAISSKPRLVNLDK